MISVMAKKSCSRRMSMIECFMTKYFSTCRDIDVSPYAIWCRGGFPSIVYDGAQVVLCFIFLSYRVCTVFEATEMFESLLSFPIISCPLDIPDC